MQDPSPQDFRDLAPILDIIREIYLIAGCALVSLDIRDGTEAWVTFVDCWERDEFHHGRQTVATKGKTFILLDPDDFDTFSPDSRYVRPGSGRGCRWPPPLVAFGGVLKFIFATRFCESVRK